MDLKFTDNANILWVDFMANGKKLAKKQKQKELVKNAKEAQITHVVVDAKIPFGMTTYQSSLSPHVSTWSDDRFKDWTNRDFLAEIIKEFNSSGIKVLANLDIFSEGISTSKDGKVYENPEWRITYYDDALTNESSAAEYSDSQTIFVNPINPEVVDYELNIIKEVCSYSIDGIVLDRCRYPNIYGDFSDLSRKLFEVYIDEEVANWPEDIYTLDKDKNINFGVLFPKWAEWRAMNIKEFISLARETVKKYNPNYLYADYVGSWFPLYYNEGLNWGSETYESVLEWTSKTYKKSGFAEQLDFLMTGCYYPEVTIDEARSNNRPEDWYSVEGAADISLEVVNNATPVVASLYLKDYENNPEQFIRAIRMCKEKTNSVMLFDFVYLEDYNWWEILKKELNPMKMRDKNE